MIKVSFIIIGYNIENYIERTLESVLNQTMSEFEVIIVSDGSTDKTLKIAEDYSQNDSRIKVISQKNSGANAARKKGYKYAKGEYIVFIDGDDWIEKNLAENLYNLAKQDNSDIIAFGHYISYNEINKTKAKIEKIGLLDDYEYLDLILSGQLSHNLWNKFLKREFLNKCEFDKIPDITMGDDLAANNRFGIYNPKVIVINEFYYNYYQNMKSVTRVISPKILEMEETIKDIEKNLSERNMLEKYKKHLEFIKFRNFYARVVKSKYKDNEITRKLYKNWKKEKINIYDNEYCLKYINSKKRAENCLMHLYNFNYKSGYLASRLFLSITKSKLIRRKI